MPAVVPVLVQNSLSGIGLASCWRELPDVPQFDGLVLAVCDQMTAVSLGVNVRDPVHVSSQDAHRFGIALVQCSRVPHLHIFQ